MWLCFLLSINVFHTRAIQLLFMDTHTYSVCLLHAFKVGFILKQFEETALTIYM